MNDSIAYRIVQFAQTLRNKLPTQLQPETPGGPTNRMDRKLPPAPRWKKHLASAGVLAIVIGAGLWIAFGKAETVYRVSVKNLTIATVTEGSFEDFVAVRALVAPFETQYISTADGGTVQKVLIQDGDNVEPGQPLVVLSNSALQLQVAARQADTAAQISALSNTRLQLQDARYRFDRDLLDADRRLSQLKAQLERNKALVEQKLIAASVYTDDERDYAHELQLRTSIVAARAAQEQVHQAQARQIEQTLEQLNNNMRLAQASLDALTVVAPLAGQLTALDAMVGQTKSPGAILGQIDSRNSFKLVANVDEFYLGRITVNQEALFTVGEQSFQAIVAQVYPQVTAGTFKVDLHFEGPTPQEIRNGQAVDLKIELSGAAQAILLPNGPFYQDTGGNWIFVVAPDGTFASRRQVRLGRRNPRYVEIEHGLEPGERVIVSSYQGFSEMTRLKLRD